MSEKNESFTDHVDIVNLEAAGDAIGRREYEETTWQAITRRPKTVFWGIYALWVLTASSYDSQAGGSFLSVPQFRKDFGFYYDGEYVIPASWQSAYTGGSYASATVGSLGASYLADRIGRRLVYLIAFAFMYVGITFEVVATTNSMFFGGKFINGFAVGAFGTVTMTYLAEISPKSLRGVTTAAAGLSYTLGPFIVSLILNAYGEMENRWAYRGIFVSQYAVTTLGLMGLPFMPESPWWLIGQGRDKKAANALRRLGHPASSTDAQIASIKATLEKVRQETEGVTFLECFKKSNLRRTIISIAPLSIQAFVGILFIINYLTYYIQLAGISTATSFKMQVGATVICMAANMTSWFLVDRVGRRNLTMVGVTTMIVILMIAGGLGSQPGNMSYVKGVIALLMIYDFVYNITIGATAYNLLAEVSTSRLRAKTASIGLAVQNAFYTMFSFVMPYLFNPDEANLGAKTTFVYGGLSVLCLIYLYFYQPETSGRTYEELDEMFIDRVPARKFRNHVTNVERRMQRLAEQSDKQET
ncbi:hypothetical protein ASPZODRAFT_160680 [Penicilliopsis zonata CBS 506.65]|uniref:Major facilitator superfamily (MFS) profile domain-containing protein n=1 Tax=Penicilliopsis zonata CBS 506.65 TaxID=1073090 RepID=A0A1L9SBL4_9EURO|nr:hypothetical protein ASPZODRAFT_160680 [Penicilliopsis zonata CBS 506.65]OJJ44590.1 hypothetical protein ASPZODRAFT_160680 [Penicilliopsis zonata CBS 506.65]